MTGAVPSNLPPEQVDPSLITESVRRAVLLEECEKYGHQFSFKNAISPGDEPNPRNEGDFPNLEVKSKVEGQLPHVYCPNCTSTWIIIDEPGFGYDEALLNVKKRFGGLTTHEGFKPRPKQERIRYARRRALQEKRNLGQNVPKEVFAWDPEKGGYYVEERQEVPSYLQPRRK